MSTELPNVQDPLGYYGDVGVAVFCGPAELGEERRAIVLSGFTGSSGEIVMSLVQFRALADAIDNHAPRQTRARPRVIEIDSSMLVVADNIIGTCVQRDDLLKQWRVTLFLRHEMSDRGQLGLTSVFRTFETVEAAHAFARETLGMEPKAEVR